MSSPVDAVLHAPDFGRYFDELPLWSSPFGMLMLEEIPLRTDITILDVGAGTGFLSLELAQRCPGSTVIAVDPWPAATTRLQEKLARFDVNNVRIEHCDAADLQLAQGTVDLIVSNLGLNNFENADAVLDRCRHVARPGATLALTTNVEGHMAEFFDVFRQVLKSDAPECLDALEHHIAHRGTADTIGALLAKAGFEPKRRIERSFQMRFANGSAMLRHRLITLGFLPAWEGMLPVASRSRLLGRLEQELDDFATGQRGLSLTIPMLYLESERR